ncbi:MAG: C39 family peptidase, partial [Bacillota bacterium]
MQKEIIESLQRAHWRDGAAFLDEEEFRGSITAQVVAVEPFDEILVNWNGRTPGDSTIKIEVQLLIEDQWTDFYPIAVWSENHGGTSLGHEDQWARTEVDLVKVKDNRRATGYRWRVQLRRTEFDSGVCLQDIFVSTRDRERFVMVMSQEIAATTLDVPCRSQMIQHKSYANLICSPTCLGMVAKYHGIDIATQKMIWKAYDRNSGIFGNWLLNAAVLGSLGFEVK